MAETANHSHAHDDAPTVHDAHGHAAHEHEEHIHEPMHYVRIWAILLVLFAISVLGPTLEIKWLTLITAFGVAFIKASLVVKYFMHLDVEKRIVHYLLVTSLVFMFMFFSGTAPDVMNHQGSNWVNLAAQHAVEKGLAAGDGHGGHGAAPAEHAPAEHEAGGH